MQNKVKSIFLLLIFLPSIALVSCKMRSEQKSLTGFFDSVDLMIEEGNYSDAMNELKKAEKKTYDSWGYIAIYKRYLQLGEKVRAEKLIQTALKKNNKSLELMALYTNFLMREGRIEEAGHYAEHLKNTKYGSFYSELELTNLKTQKSPEELEQLFRDKRYYNIYLDAYKGSNDSVWLRNCVLFNLEDGKYEQAALLYPGQLNDADDAYFWGLVLYDSGRYYDAVSALETSRRLSGLQGALDSKLSHASEIQRIALESDAYIAISDMEKAEEARKLITSKLENYENISDEDMQILSAVILNSAIYARNTGDDNQAADLLLYIVDRWPDMAQGLILYSDFAYQSNQEREEDFETQELRKAGIKTLEMEEYDNRRKIPLSDAVYRIDRSLENKMNPYLEIAKLDLKYKMDSSYTLKQKTADLWKMLEENYTDEVKFESLLVQYALSFLLKTKQYEDAYVLFKKHISTTYNFQYKKHPEEEFWQQLENVIPELDVKMQEFAALIAMNQKKYNLSYRLYEQCVYGGSGSVFEDTISPFVSTGACMNLADIYYSVGLSEKAIDLYGKAAGRESSRYLRSEIFYRIACIYSAAGNNRDALKALDYAVQLYPDNARANLLKTKIRQ